MRAQKRLGQHFLHDGEVLGEIAAMADVGRSAGALEIGPGEGALTAFLLRDGKPVVALEKDERALAVLEARFGGRVRVVLGDALTADLGALLPPPEASGRRAVVVGNLPYNVGSAIYRRLLGLRGQVERLVLMLQREVALRIVATAGNKAYGIPSVMTALLARAHLVLEVPPEAFRPRPKVHSAVVLVEFRDTLGIGMDELPGFEPFLARLMQSRRKIVTNSLPDAEDTLAALGIPLKSRPEQIDPDTLVRLFRVLRDAGHEAATLAS